MSDRRTVLLVLALLAALAGAGVAVAALLALRDPLWRGGELAAQVDVSGPLVAALVLGLLLALAGAAVATTLVRAQFRKHDVERPRDRAGRIVP